MGLRDLLKGKGKDVYEERGGAEAAKGDAAELKDIARGEGSLAEKGKEAVEALKEPGARGA